MKHNSILTNTIAIVMLIFGIASCNSGSSDNKEIDASYIESKSTIENQEKEKPLAFLSIDATHKKNLFGMWVIEGDVTNSATLVTYKDIEIEVNYYSKENELLGTSTEVIPDEFPASETNAFKIKITGFEKTNNIDWKIINASAK